VKTTIRIGDRLIGEGQPCFVIAEGGVNHNGDRALALKLVDIAARAGADAIKFQKRSIPDILVRAALDARYVKPTSLGATYGEHRARLELSDDVYSELMDAARKRDVLFLASAWDRPSADFLERLGVPAFKIASADLTNLPLIDHIAAKAKPVLLSTGMSTLEEVADAVTTVRRHHDELILLQCTSTYPAENEDLNLRAMELLRREFGVLVGYSGHERGLAPTEAAVALGAVVVERHITTDRTLPGPDHAASLEPRGLELLVRNIRNIEAALGAPIKRVLDRERPVRERLAKSVVAARDIHAGQRITANDLTVKGPGHGISPRFLRHLVGVVAKVDVAADTLLPPEALQWR
jgi:sialic acid synthase SpsE